MVKWSLDGSSVTLFSNIFVQVTHVAVQPQHYPWKLTLTAELVSRLGNSLSLLKT